MELQESGGVEEPWWKRGSAYHATILRLMDSEKPNEKIQQINEFIINYNWKF